ncbi:hypothetical protein LXL04_039834 [Taraxacum kok-saghyz]
MVAICLKYCMHQLIFLLCSPYLLHASIDLPVVLTLFTLLSGSILFIRYIFHLYESFWFVLLCFPLQHLAVGGCSPQQKWSSIVDHFFWIYKKFLPVTDFQVGDAVEIVEGEGVYKFATYAAQVRNIEGETIEIEHANFGNPLAAPVIEIVHASKVRYAPDIVRGAIMYGALSLISSHQPLYETPLPPNLLPQFDFLLFNILIWSTVAIEFCFQRVQFHYPFP